MELPNQTSPTWPLVNEVGEASSVSRSRMDELWSLGWRHFGPKFFRYSLMYQGGEWKRVINLRLDLTQWQPSKSQRRTLRANEDLQIDYLPAEPGEEERSLFHRHKVRFSDNIPDELSEFLGEEPNGCPGACLQVSARLEGELIAASFLDLGKEACSSIYGIFNPDETRRRLGIFTMMCEMLYAQEQGLKYYYLGYACLESSPYDYKKELRPLEVFDWQGWHSLTPGDYSKQALPIPEALLEYKRERDC